MSDLREVQLASLGGREASKKRGTKTSMEIARLASSCAPYKIQNPSERQNTPQNTPRILSRNQNTEKIRKNYENPQFSYFFRILVSGEDSGCILGCLLALGGVLYSVGGARTRKARPSDRIMLLIENKETENFRTTRNFLQKFCFLVANRKCTIHPDLRKKY